MGPGTHAESPYSFLERSGRPEIARVRSLVDQWLLEYPERSRSDLVARFKSKNIVQHVGALNELFLHATFLRLGYSIDVASPSARNSARPDLYLTDDNGDGFDIEVTTAAVSRDELAKSRRENDLLDGLNQMHSPNFYLRVAIVNESDAMPSVRQIRARLARWVDGLDPDAVSHRLNSGLGLPELVWNCDGWQMNFSAMPKSPNAPRQSSIQDSWVIF